MRASVLCWILMATWFCGCTKSSLYISGDAQGVGSEVYIDNQKAAIMEKKVYAGSSSVDNVVREREALVGKRIGVRPGDVFSAAKVRVWSGRHEVVVVNSAGKRLSANVDIRGEGYVFVNFDNMIIQGGD